ncbi:hypothetical protein EDC96DRAFT_498909 [Choanephora cucurbitarum]|nr:hypothetical protein EDC96DRAFT_498909 [Choanephora cucurbitarum]
MLFIVVLSLLLLILDHICLLRGFCSVLHESYDLRFAYIVIGYLSSNILFSCNSWCYSILVLSAH